MAATSPPARSPEAPKRRVGRPRAGERELGQSREQILEAAARVLSTRGYDGASLSEIARAAGLSTGTLYFNFASKEAILFALLEERVVPQLQALIDLTAGASEPVAPRVGAGLNALLADEGDTVKLFHELCAVALREPALQARLAERLSDVRARLGRALAEHQRLTGLPLTMPSEQFAVAQLALAGGLSLTRLIDATAVADDLYKNILELLADGMRHRAARSAGQAD